jgi:phospholipase/lecithinase/hemolysin
MHVPPVYPSTHVYPALQSGVEEEMKDRCQTWNDLLASRVREFAQGSSKANALLFSANKWLSGFLDDPQAYGFSTEDVSKEDGTIWTDNLHLTSAVHRLLGKAIYDALCVTR